MSNRLQDSAGTMVTIRCADGIRLDLPLFDVLRGLGAELVNVGEKVQWAVPNIYSLGTRPGLRVTVEVIPRAEET